MEVNIYKIDDLNECMNTLFEQKKKRNPRYSIRAWAKQLGYNSAAFLGQVMKGQRSANMPLLRRIKESEDLDEAGWRHLKVLYLKSLYNDEDPIFDELMLSLNKRDYDITFDRFELLSEWFYLAIYELAKHETFTPDAKTIQRALKFDLSEDKINDAIKLLQEIGMLDEHGKRDHCKKIGVVSQREENDLSADIEKFISDKPNKIIRNYHHKNIDLAKVAIEEQSIDERFVSSSSVSLNKENLEKANKILKEAHMKILELPLSSDATSIYQFNAQFFKIADITKLDEH